MRRTPPDPHHALMAAWLAFTQSDTGEPEIPGLLQMAAALHALDRDAQGIQVWQAVVERAPNNQTYRKALNDLRRAVGVQVQRVRTETDSDPARACIEFTVPPVHRSDFAPG